MIRQCHPRRLPEAELVLDEYALRVYGPCNEASPAAPAIFMLHGLAEAWHIWAKICDQLPDSLGAYCLEMPWNGQNGHHWGQIWPAADWLHQALQITPTSPTVLIAHSLGANAALEYLQHHQIRGLRALVLVSPFYLAHDKEFNWAFFDQAPEIFRAIMMEGLEARQGTRKFKPLILLDMVNKVQELVGPRGFMEFLTLLMRTPHLNLAHLHVPVLVVGGRHDPGSTPASNAALARALPNAHFRLLPESGHFCMLTHPDALTALLHQFLSHCLEGVDGMRRPLEGDRHERP